QVAQDLGQAHDREFAGIEPGFHAGGTHRVAADACELRVRIAFLQHRDQAGAQLVPRGFAGDQREALALAAHRNSGRSPASMKASNARTSSLSRASSASCPRASSSFAPETYSAL